MCEGGGHELGVEYVHYRLRRTCPCFESTSHPRRTRRSTLYTVGYTDSYLVATIAAVWEAAQMFPAIRLVVPLVGLRERRRDVYGHFRRGAAAARHGECGKPDPQCAGDLLQPCPTSRTGQGWRSSSNVPPKRRSHSTRWRTRSERSSLPDLAGSDLGARDSLFGSESCSRWRPTRTDAPF